MGYIILAIKNLIRQPIRSLLTIFGVAIAVAVLVSLIAFNRGYKQSLENDINKLGYEVLVTAKGCPYEAATLLMQGGEIPRYIDDEVYNKIKDHPQIKQMTKLFLNATIKDTGGFQLFMGIDEEFLPLRPWMDKSNKLQKEIKWLSDSSIIQDDQEPMEVILGYEAAELLTRKVGDELYIEKPMNQVFKVVGIFDRSGTQDDGTVFLPLKTAQKVFKQQEKLTGLGIKLNDITKYDQFVDEIDKTVPEVQVVTFEQVKGALVDIIQTANMLIMAVAMIAIAVSIIGVLNTILMSVVERTSEIGIMKAMGASSPQIFRFIWLETIFICLIGGFIGNIIALVAGSGIESLLRNVLSFSPSGTLVAVTPDIVTYSLVGAIVLGLLSGFYPALRASKMDPIKAIYSV